MNEAKEIAGRFLPQYEIEEVSAISSGHIQQTVLITAFRKKVLKRIILQTINTAVFPDPELLVSNHLNLINHLSTDPRIIPELVGIDKVYLIEAFGQFWRAQEYVENSITHLRATNPKLAFEGAKMIGRFIKTFSDLNPVKINPSIPQFHHLPKYLKIFDDVLGNGNRDRISASKNITDWINSNRKSFLGRFKKLQNLPDRICHADTKISNILFDKDTNKAIKVIDLDTVMPGKVAFDFADMVRSFVPSIDENNQNIEDLTIQKDIFESLCKGFLSETKDILDKDEIDLLFDGALVLIYEQTVRFFWDYLNNDQYYPVSHPNQNHDRTQNQLKLLQELLSFEKQAKTIIYNSL